MLRGVAWGNTPNCSWLTRRKRVATIPVNMGRQLTRAIRGDFPSDVRRRGDSYFSRGAVHVAHTDSTSIHALVTGQDDYTVLLEWSGPEIRAFCDCPYFDQYGPCKHLWAVALAYDAGGKMPARLDGKALVMAGDEADDDLEDFEDDDGLEYPEDDDDLADGAYDDRDEDGVIVSRHADMGRILQFRPAPSRPPTWKQLLAGLHDSARYDGGRSRDALPADSQLSYIIDVATTLAGGGLAVHVLLRKRKKNGDWGVEKPRALSREQIGLLPDPTDRQIAALLLGACTQPYAYYGYGDYSRSSTFLLHETLTDAAMPLLCGSGRCRLQTKAGEEFPPLQLDGGAAWQFRLVIRKDEAAKQYVLSGSLRRDRERQDLASPVMLTQGGWVFWPDRAARLNDHGAFGWIWLLRQEKEVRVPVRQADELLERLLRVPAVPPMDLPAELGYQEVRPAPRLCLRIRKPGRRWGQDLLTAELGFEYDGQRVDNSSPERGIYLKESRRLILRDPAVEHAAEEKLKSLGLRRDAYEPAGRLQLRPKLLPRVVAELVAENWYVHADGSLYRRAGKFEMVVSSGIDWFELHGSADFGGVAASLPQLLAALRKGEQFVRLDDGSLGILPEQWLRKFGLLASVATTQKDHLRFKQTQAGFLDALLAAQPEATCDEAFSRAREELRRFERITPANAPAGFVGTLRPYQRDGLGWLHFLQRFGFGGCLADDMGLGKTVQVLALLESRRQLRASGSGNGERPAPSLAVVPRSLIFNWRQEAARFTPAMRVLDHVGTGRTKGRTDHFDDYDLILTTYGTMRRDAAHLKDVLFDYVVLDESQAIKNAKTASAKAARLLQASHRLCLSGTPIENHLGELWSQFEVLNPGMLGASPVLAAGANGTGGPEEPTPAQLLARVLRPFILRRTKGQVAADLPAKTEQTLYCELDATQRKLYEELRDHYRQALLARVARDGMNKVKIQILEALLRLRQAAIHPGLIDKARIGKSSAKLESLLPQLREVLEEGHKALVFSQFTSMLSIVRSRLDDERIVYEYLDGRTRDRQARVDRFQNDPQCGLFLISLKAGGLGLNLTAADYVFLLDPWWNPAVEAQAVDRAHRIGQQRQVFAYRLIARDTVEERILELQESKRSLADAIINADNSLLRNLSREDLELLLR